MCQARGRQRRASHEATTFCFDLRDFLSIEGLNSLRNFYGTAESRTLPKEPNLDDLLDQAGKRSLRDRNSAKFAADLNRRLKGQMGNHKSRLRGDIAVESYGAFFDL